MSENSTETVKESSGMDSTTTPPAESSRCKRGSSCTPHASIIIAFIALILAGYAVYSAAQGHDNSAMEARIAQMENQTTGISGQIARLDAQIKSNRENLIQTKLKKALQNIQDIGNLAGEGTKAAITEVENMLKTLTAISDQLASPAPTETTPPASIESATEPAAEPETAPETSAPAKIVRPESTQSESTPPEPAQAEPSAAPEQPAAAEPTTTAPDSSAVEPAPATTETTPPGTTKTTPAKTPAKDQTASATPPTDTAPVAEPSAPQAF